MLENGFEPEFSPAVMREVRSLEDPSEDSLPPGCRDLRSLAWSSVDNRESRDLDQIEVAERVADGSIRVRIGVADVDTLVRLGSAADEHAATNTTSVYTGVAVFPMLPERLSTDLTSLNQGEDRLAVVIEFDVSPEGELSRRRLQAWCQQSQATYDASSLARGKRRRSGDCRFLRAPRASPVSQAAHGLRAREVLQPLDFESVEASRSWRRSMSPIRRPPRNRARDMTKIHGSAQIARY